MNFPKLFAVLIYTLIATLFVPAQQTPRHPGIALYDQGKYSEAISSLERAVKQPEFKADASLWNYLGLSQIEAGTTKSAVKSLAKAVSLSSGNLAYRVNLAYAYLRNRQVNRAQAETEAVIKVDPNFVAAHFIHGTANMWERKFDLAIKDADAVIAIDKTYADAYILKASSKLAQLGSKQTDDDADVDLNTVALSEAVDVLRTGAAAVQKPSDKAKIDSELESMQAFYNYFDKQGRAAAGPPTAPGPNDVPLKIISKPRASYTDSARQNGVQGNIRIAVLFGASGRIEYILLIKGLGYGLDQNAIGAAKRIKFEPAKKDGKPVSVVKQIMYGFTIY